MPCTCQKFVDGVKPAAAQAKAAPPVPPSAKSAKPQATVGAPSAAPKAKDADEEVIRVPIDTDSIVGRNWNFNEAYVGDLIGILNAIIKTEGRHVCNERLAPYNVRIANIQDITEEHAKELFRKAKIKYVSKAKPSTPGSSTPAAEPPAPTVSNAPLDKASYIDRLKAYALKAIPDAGPCELMVHQLMLVKRVTGDDLDAVGLVVTLSDEKLARLDAALNEEAKK